MDAAPMESHGKLARVSPTDAFQFHLVFSNKTESDSYCLEVWTQLTARSVQVWQQKKNIPKDSDNWFSEWYPSANMSIKIVCFLTAAYLRSVYCMKEFRVAQAMDKLLVVVCEPMQAIRAVDPSQYPHASDALAYLLGGGQVIFHDSDDVVEEILKFIPREAVAAAVQSEPEPQQPEPQQAALVAAADVASWPVELTELVTLPTVARCLAQLGVDSLDAFAENIDLEEGHDAMLQAVLAALPDKPKKARLQRNRAQMVLADLLLRLRLFEEFDTNQTGSLSRVDCMRIPAQKMLARAGGPVGDQFDAIDTNRDGRISFSDLFAHTMVCEGEDVPPSAAELHAQEAQRAFEAQRVQLEEQAAALQRQQSALAKQEAAVETEKRLMVDTRVKIKAEQDAASLTLARKLYEEEDAARRSAVMMKQEQKRQLARDKAYNVSGDWINIASARFQYKLVLLEAEDGQVSGSGTFGTASRPKANGGPFKLDGVRKGDQLALTQTWGTDGNYNVITSTIVAGDGGASSFAGKWRQLDRQNTEKLHGEAHARRLVDEDFKVSRTWTTVARNARGTRWEYKMTLLEEEDGQVSGSGTFGADGGPFKLAGVRKGDQLRLSQTWGTDGKHNIITYTVVAGDGVSQGFAGKWRQLDRRGTELGSGDSHAVE
jgi:hypothetical protein